MYACTLWIDAVPPKDMVTVSRRFFQPDDVQQRTSLTKGNAQQTHP